MREQIVRSFTYEDVRSALEKRFEIKLSGVKVSSDNGYIVKECPKDEQPSEPKESE